MTVLLGFRALPFLLKYPLLKRGLDPAVGRIVGSFAAFWKWSVVSAFLFPVIFAGLPVINARAVEGDVAAAFALGGQTSPLRWTFENLGQAAYLTLNLAAIVYVAFVSRQNGQSRRAMKALRGAIFAVAVIAMLQSFVAWRGLDFPLLFFKSNAAYSQGYGGAFDAVRRVNATFDEASYAGGFLAAAVLGMLAARLRGGYANLSSILLLIVSLILTTATTGYAALVIGAILLSCYFVRRTLSGRLPRRVLWQLGGGALLAVGAVVLLLTLDAPLRQAALDSTIGKADTVSSFSRVSVDLYSLRLLAGTYGLGTGLGSNRPSSLGAYLLSNVGIVGSVLFVVFVLRLLKCLFRVSRSEGRGSYAMVAWMLVGILIAQGLALPDISWPPFWGTLMMGVSLLVAETSRLRQGEFVLHKWTVRPAAQGPAPAGA